MGDKWSDLLLGGLAVLQPVVHLVFDLLDGCCLIVTLLAHILPCWLINRKLHLWLFDFWPLLSCTVGCEVSGRQAQLAELRKKVFQRNYLSKSPNTKNTVKYKVYWGQLLALPLLPLSAAASSAGNPHSTAWLPKTEAKQIWDWDWDGFRTRTRTRNEQHPLPTWMVWGRFLIDRYNQMVSFRGRMSCQWGRSWALNQPIRENQHRHPSARGRYGDDSTPYLSVLSWLVHLSSSAGLELTFFFFSRFFLLSSSSCKRQWLAGGQKDRLTHVLLCSIRASECQLSSSWLAVSPTASPSKWTRWWRSVPQSEWGRGGSPTLCCSSFSPACSKRLAAANQEVHWPGCHRICREVDPLCMCSLVVMSQRALGRHRGLWD